MNTQAVRSESVVPLPSRTQAKTPALAQEQLVVAKSETTQQSLGAQNDAKSQEIAAPYGLSTTQDDENLGSFLDFYV